jgi:hypothetical protein
MIRKPQECGPVCGELCGEFFGGRNREQPSGTKTTVQRWVCAGNILLLCGEHRQQDLLPRGVRGESQDGIGVCGERGHKPTDIEGGLLRSVG